jgi:hypothetical protein
LSRKDKRSFLLNWHASARKIAPLTIPTRWVNGIIAVFLLPIVIALSGTFFSAFSNVALNQAFWATEEFWFFALGALLWVIAFFGLPRPVLLYVFGHEMTHALWVWMMGGRVSAFRIRRDGGHIITDKNNFLIALAPYFFPIYSVGAILAYGGAGLFHDVLPYRQLLFAVIGMTWAFHISFTIWMIPKGQSDLTYHGTFFSLVIIYLMNLAVLSALLIIASPDVTLANFSSSFADRLADVAAWLTAWY